MNTTRDGRPYRFATALTVVTLTVAGVTGCSEAAHEEDRPLPAANAAANGAGVEPAAWGSCPAVAEGADRDSRLTCATVTVPLNYDDPDGTTIDVVISRLAAADPQERRGVLLLNPGGPALSGLDMPSTMSATLPQSVLDEYDLIGFDPRGVGNSTPQSCGLKVASVPGHFPYPAADGSIDANVELARDEAQRCAANVGDSLRYFTTANTARDLDRIREALGEQQISYWGQSYGTYLGAVYSSLFPAHTDRMILEGNIDPTKVWSGVVEGWGEATAERFPDASAVAAAQNDTLGLGSTVEQVTQTYLALADRLDREPAPVPGTEQSLTGAILRTTTYALLLDNATLPILAQVWKAAADLADGQPTDADGEVLAQVFAETPPTPGVPEDNQATMFLALTCGDAEWSHDVADYAARSAADRDAWPLTAGMPANIWPCAFWDAPVEQPVTVTDQGGGDILILQNRRDHATSWESGQGLRKALGDRATFVGVDNGGHYVYGRGSECADAATVNFLTTGTLPDEDVYCTDVAPS